MLYQHMLKNFSSHHIINQHLNKVGGKKRVTEPNQRIIPALSGYPFYPQPSYHYKLASALHELQWLEQSLKELLELSHGTK